MVAKAFADLIDNNVENEAELRAKWVTYLEALQIPLRLEMHPSRGSLLRLDASYNYTIIEFKSPNLFKGKHANALKAINQLRLYIKDRALNERQPINKYSGIYTDGIFAGIVQFTDESINQEIQKTLSPSKQMPAFKNWGKLDADFTNQIIHQLRHGFSLFSVTNLLGLFGHGSEFSTIFQSNLAKYLQYNLNLPNSSVRHLLTEWKKLFVQISSPNDTDKEKLREKYADIIASCQSQDETDQLSFVLFVIHTYNYFVTRLLAAELVSVTKRDNYHAPEVIHRLSAKILHTRPPQLHKLLDDNLESINGSMLTNLCSFHQIPFFSWYLDAIKGNNDADQTAKNISELLNESIRKLAGEINKFDLACVHLVMEDVLKKLYQDLVSPELRHSLGEYYTPNWMTSYVINECVDIDNWLNKRVLDPTCGSGSFLLEAIRKKRMAYSQLDEKCYSSSDIDLLLKLISDNKFELGNCYVVSADKLIYLLPSNNLTLQTLDTQGNICLLPEIRKQTLKEKMEITVLCPCIQENKQWSIIELQLSKDKNLWSGEFYLHDPRGKGKLDEVFFTSLEKDIQVLLEEVDGSVEFGDFLNIESPYITARQHQNDKSASGPIVVEELVKLINGYTLDVYEPYGIGASVLRLKHFQELEKVNDERPLGIDYNSVKGLMVRLKDEDLLTDIMKNVWGFDLNPLAVQIASLNFMVVTMDLISKCWDVDFTIPVALADAVYFPSKQKKLRNDATTQDIYQYAVPHLNLNISLPAALVEDRFDIFEAFVKAMSGRGIRLPSKFDEFLQNYLRRNLMDSQDSQNDELLDDLETYKENLRTIYDQIYRLRANNQDGIWLQIIRSFLTAVRAGDFDVVLGNPPWVGWRNLPEEYRTQVTNTYHKKYPSLMKSGEGEDGRRNIAAIIIHTTADKWLNQGGQMAVVIPTSLLQDKAQKGFREFELGGNNVLQPQKVNVFKNLYLFDNTYHEPSILSLKKNKKKAENFKQALCIEWCKSENGSNEINIALPLEEVYKRTCRTERIAVPLNAEPGARWLFTDKEASLVLNSFKGEWPLQIESGIETRGANDIYFVSLESINGNIARIRLKNGETARVESKFIYRLIKGAGNIKKNYFHFDNQYVIVPNRGTDKDNLQKAAAKLQEGSSSKLLAFLQGHENALRNRKFRSRAQNDYWWRIHISESIISPPYKVLYPEITASVAGFRVAVAGPVIEPGNEVNLNYIPDHKIYFIGFEAKHKARAYYLAGLLNCEMIRRRVEGAVSGLSGCKIFESGILPGLPKYNPDNENCKALAIKVEKSHGIADEQKREKLNEKIESLAHTYLTLLHTLCAAKAAPSATKGSIQSFFLSAKKTHTNSIGLQKVDRAEKQLVKESGKGKLSVTFGKKEGIKGIANFCIEGLKYQEIPGDGHCLFHAVGLYLGEDQQFLRMMVAEHLDKNSEQYREYFDSSSGQTLEDYITGIREGLEWASEIEIEILMRVLNRPIAIIGPERTLRNRDSIERFDKKPIFVYYNGHNHYDALLLKGDKADSAILTDLQNNTRELAIPSSSASLFFVKSEKQQPQNPKRQRPIDSDDESDETYEPEKKRKKR